MTMKNNNSIYSPQNLDQAKELAQLLTIKGNPRESLVAHATFGHHFGGNMAVTLANSFVLQGKPSLGADAMSGIVRASGLCRYMRITEWNDSVCVMEFARTDEPSEITHTHTFTMEMAVKQGLTNNRNWKQMPRQMLRARVLTMGLRAVYPDAISGIYSPDELADNMSMSDDERYAISAQSLGEEVVHSPSRGPVSYTDDDYSTGADAETMTKRDADRPFTNIPF
jgi:hypothetical protein